MAYKLIITDEANDDIDEIIGYISNVLKNPAAAGSLLSEIEKSYDTISHSPESFPYCKDKYLRTKGYRKIIVKNYTIFYRVAPDANIVYIMRVIYSKRDYANII